MVEAIDRAVNFIKQRLAEIREEEKRLERALRHLVGSDGRSAGKAPSPRAATTGRSRRSKRAAPGEREKQFRAALEKHPGASMSELAQDMGVRPQQLYPIARRLKAAGAITKRDGGYVVKQPAKKAS